MPLSKSNGNAPVICFDEEHRIRVLDTDRVKHTEDLHYESNQFVASKWAQEPILSPYRIEYRSNVE